MLFLSRVVQWIGILITVQNRCNNPRKFDLTEIIVANNERLAVKSSGSCATIYGDQDVIKVENVLYVPQLSVNSLCVSQIVENTYKIIFDKS